jgi:hypothetical protein
MDDLILPNKDLHPKQLVALGGAAKLARTYIKFIKILQTTCKANKLPMIISLQSKKKTMIRMGVSKILRNNIKFPRPRGWPARGQSLRSIEITITLREFINNNQ